MSVWLWESGDSALKEAPGSCSGALSFSPDSRRLVVGNETWITCFDLGTGEQIVRWAPRDRAYRIAFHPDSRRLAVSYLQSEVVSIYAAEDGAHLADLPIGASKMTVIAWHPDGNLLAVAGSDRRIQIWDVNTRRKLAVLEGHVQQVNFLMFHWSGDLLASASWDNVLRFWQPLPGRLLMKLAPRETAFSQERRWSGVNRPDTHQAQLWGVVQSQEYHTFLNTFGDGEVRLWDGDISPDGTLLAVAATDGVHLWDVARGREVARLTMGETWTTMFRPNGRELLTCGPVDGLQRWNITANAEGDLQLGPPHRIELPFAAARIARGGDDQTLGVVGERAGQCVILDLATETVRAAGMPHPKVGYAALSPDAQHMATTGWQSDRLKLWDATGGKLIKDLEVGLCTRVYFTPQGELIVAHDKEFTFHSLDSLAVNRRIPREIGLYAGHVAFTADGKMMALEIAPGVIHLKETSSGRTIAKLEDPNGDISAWIGFTPDSTQLLVVAPFAGAIHRWDLRAIRTRLKAMNLDWDWPAFSSPGDALLTRKAPRKRHLQILTAKPTGVSELPAR